MASAKIAQGKARTAVMFRRPSKSFADEDAAGNSAFMTFPERPVASEGGVPIVVNGKIIGAVGAARYRAAGWRGLGRRRKRGQIIATAAPRKSRAVASTYSRSGD